jgi:hypothetical protein
MPANRIPTPFAGISKLTKKWAFGQFFWPIGQFWSKTQLSNLQKAQKKWAN